jgi:hypothetical protein
MPLRALLVAPDGFGVDWVVHAPPFQVSARVADPEAPTAVQLLVEGHDTPDRSPLAAVLWIVQVVPSHASARVELPDAPTAVQALAAGHETAVNWLEVV